MTFVTEVGFWLLTRNNEYMNIIQEALVTAWFLMKTAFFSLTVVGAVVVWKKYGSLITPLFKVIEKRASGYSSPYQAEDEDDHWGARL